MVAANLTLDTVCINAQVLARELPEYEEYRLVKSFLETIGKIEALDPRYQRLQTNIRNHVPGFDFILKRPSGERGEFTDYLIVDGTRQLPERGLYKGTHLIRLSTIAPTARGLTAQGFEHLLNGELSDGSMPGAVLGAMVGMAYGLAVSYPEALGLGAIPGGMLGLALGGILDFVVCYGNFDRYFRNGQHLVASSRKPYNASVINKALLANFS